MFQCISKTYIHWKLKDVLSYVTAPTYLLKMLPVYFPNNNYGVITNIIII